MAYRKKVGQEEDSRKIAIYARKSKITESGKSIENQIVRCRDYITAKFGKQREENIVVYQDEGLSGFYSDRPNYQRMLRDIQHNQIRAVICYKFDRISRKTVDLFNLVESLERKKVAFISCSNEIDTSTDSGRMMMRFLAILAEFERDIIAERISDNLHELAKEGRWLGGTTPTGYRSRKESILVSGHKSTVHHLEPVEKELQMVKEIYRQFLEKRSLEQVAAYLCAHQIPTKNGAAHTKTSVKNILSNPVYGIADAVLYQYFQALGVSIYASREEFDGIHGMMVYNKTEQLKIASEESTAIHPKYVQRVLPRDKKDWIVAVGRHPGIISGSEWTQVQAILTENRSKFSRPNEKTQSLLSGLIACPFCGKSMHTFRESGRYTQGCPRFLYKCPTRRAEHSACAGKDVKGNEVDACILDLICALSEPGNEYYGQLLETRLRYESQACRPQSEMEQAQKAVLNIQREMDNQLIALRSVETEATRNLLLADLQKLNEGILAAQSRLEQTKRREAAKSEAAGIERLEQMRSLLSSFPELIRWLSYQEKMELVRKVVEKVFVLPGEDGNQQVHIFLKGATAEMYESFFRETAEGYWLCAGEPYRIFNTLGCISSKPGALAVGETGNRFDQANCADG